MSDFTPSADYEKGEVYLEGRWAFTQGYPMDSCKYQKGHSGRYPFLMGWMDEKYDQKYPENKIDEIVNRISQSCESK